MRSPPWPQHPFFCKAALWNSAARGCVQADAVAPETSNQSWGNHPLTSSVCGIWKTLENKWKKTMMKMIRWWWWWWRRRRQWWWRDHDDDDDEDEPENRVHYHTLSLNPVLNESLSLVKLHIRVISNHSRPAESAAKLQIDFIEQSTPKCLWSRGDDLGLITRDQLPRGFLLEWGTMGYR